MTIDEKIKKLRECMKREGMDAYIVTKSDPHQSEYTADYWNQVRFISGFSGSAGTVVVTGSEAGLWTDGRYYIQAERELAGSGVTLYKGAEPGTKDFLTFARDAVPEGGAIGFYGHTLSMANGRKLQEMAKYKQIELKTELDLVGEFWENRPELSRVPLFDHEVRFCGKSRTEKIAELREKVWEMQADTYILSSTDDVAWLFNLRGNDLPGVPFFAAFAVVDRRRVALFVHKERARVVESLLQRDGIVLKDYGELTDYLGDYEAVSSQGGCRKTALLNPEKTSHSLARTLEGWEIQTCTPDLTAEMKAVKNPVELDNLERAHVRDGVAMVRFGKWLKENAASGELDEYAIGAAAERFREGGENYVEPSFNTIAGYMENGAVMHYRALEGSCAGIKPEGLLLVDSGGHYFDGTTDITRTYVLGKILDKMKRDFSLTVKSHISLARAVFLYGATGANLDVLARMPMWSRCMDYKSGTGHGIGFFLNVHEGPQVISQRSGGAVLEPGMVVSNEPGVYRQGEYGIRIENIMKVVDYQETEFGRFLRFEVISWCPIDLAGIDRELLTEEEREWLNHYHQKVYEKLSPYLSPEERDWLAEETREI